MTSYILHIHKSEGGILGGTLCVWVTSLCAFSTYNAFSMHTYGMYQNLVHLHTVQYVYVFKYVVQLHNSHPWTYVGHRAHRRHAEWKLWARRVTIAKPPTPTPLCRPPLLSPPPPLHSLPLPSLRLSSAPTTEDDYTQDISQKWICLCVCLWIHTSTSE